MFDDLGEEALASLVSGITSLASHQNALPRGYDKGVLLALREGGKLFTHGVTEISFDLQTQKEHDGKILTFRIEDIEIIDEETAFEGKGATPFFEAVTLEALANEQGIGVADFDSLYGDFWPQDEPPDEFISAVRKWRNEAITGDQSI